MQTSCKKVLAVHPSATVCVVTHARSARLTAIGKLVELLREERGWTQIQLADKLGIAPTSVGRKERGEIPIKPPERNRIAKVFGMTIEEFDERWRASRVDRTQGGRGIPVINRAPAGQVLDYEEYGIDSGQGFEYIDWGDVTDDLAFAVIVVGESMEPRIHEGDYLVFTPMTIPKPRAKLEHGDVVFIRFTQESDHEGCTLARWFIEEGGKIRLHKDNPKYPPLFCTREDIRQLNVCIQRRTAKV